MVDVVSPEELEQINRELQGEEREQGAPAQPPGEFLGREQAAALCDAVFGVVAARFGDHWRLAPQEAEALGGALDAVLAKYMPADGGQYGPEAALAITTAMIVLPRLQRQRQEAAEDAKHAA